ncbi:tyrosinase family protein [Caulobacter sp. CCG-8]|uniref:tyrosinase family protein n=1 Tax=Caulobacter sp. CCG-8 TaxID=3127958 RepID=UPI00307D6C8C
MVETRRDVMIGALAGATAVGFGGLEAQAQTVSTRYSATSPQGKAMLVKYAKAVDIMRNQIPAGDPRHWNFQWYTHWIPGSANWNQAVQTKNQMLQQIYGSQPSYNRDLASAMWDSCQPHSYDPSNPTRFLGAYFLPWHRWFVYYFEQIIRNVLQDASFTLPYWDYLQGSVAALSIPPEFYTNTSSPLYKPNRNTWVNQGQRIDQQNPGALNLNAFKYGYYISNDGSTGFCPTLNNNPHGMVHDLTGNSTNMGYVPTAAGDPVFWLHHCNIDRLWASWNNMGYGNPDWGTRLFPFANGQGKRVDVLLNNASTIGKLGYQYDTYQKVPGAKRLRAPQFLKTAPLAATAAVAGEHHGGVTLSATGPTLLKLASPPRASNSGGSNLLAAAPPSKGGGVFLALAGVMADEAFGGTYNVYVGLPEGATPGGADSPNYVGTFGSFNLVGHEHGPNAGPSLVFDITDKAADLTAKGQLGPSPSVTFVPQGEIGKPPTVASVSIVTA